MDRPPLILLVASIAPVVIAAFAALGAMWLQVGRLDVFVFAEDFGVAVIASFVLIFLYLLVFVFGFGPAECHRCTKRIWWHKVVVQDFANRHYHADEWTGEDYEHVPTFAYHRACYRRNNLNKLTA